MKLEPLESAVLQKLLDGEHPVLEALRKQVRALSVVERQQTKTGFFVKFSTPQTDPAPTGQKEVRFGDVQATIDGLSHGAGFLLYVDKGFIRMLEGYSYEEPWPDHIVGFALTYSKKDRTRELSKLS